MKKYMVDFGTGAGNLYADTIDEAMELADKNACFTEQNIYIIGTETGQKLYVRNWYGTNEGLDLNDNPIDYGANGHYADWRIVE